MTSLPLFFLTRTLRRKNSNKLHGEYYYMIGSIILSVTIISTALNLFEGYQRAFKRILLDTSSHIYIFPNEPQGLNREESSLLISKLASRPEIKSIEPVLLNSAIVKAQSKFQACVVKAYPTKAMNNSLPWFWHYTTDEQQKLRSGNIVIGYRLAEELHMQAGDSLSLLNTQLNNISPMGILPREQRFRIQATLKTGYYEIDKGMIIMQDTDAFEFYSLIPGYSFLEVHLFDKWVDRADILSQKIQAALKTAYQVNNWKENNSNLFSLITLEKWLVFLVFSFLMLLAAINSISSVSTLLIEHQKDVALLKTIGTSIRHIRQVFYTKVMIISVVAVSMGLLSGYVIAWLITKQSIYQLKGDVYFIDKLYISVSPVNYLLIFITSLLLLFLCIRIPLQSIKQMRIVEILRRSGV